MRDRVFQVVKATVGGYLLVFLLGISAISVVSMVGLALGASAIDLGVGPVPLLTFRNGASGYSFQSEWGIGAMATVAAAICAGVAIWQQLKGRETAPRNGSTTPG
jgi:hypothetical protein